MGGGVGKERLRRPVFDDAATAKDKDSLDGAEGREAVRDDEGGAAFAEDFKILLEAGFSFHIQGTGGFVENNNSGGRGGKYGREQCAGAAPPERRLPRSPQMVSKPFSCWLIKSRAWARRAASSISGSVALARPKRIFSRMCVIPNKRILAHDGSPSGASGGSRSGRVSSPPPPPSLSSSQVMRPFVVRDRSRE